MRKRKIAKKRRTLGFLCRNCILKHNNGDCPSSVHLRKLYKDTDIYQMSNTSFLCETVKSVLEEEDKLLRKKAKEPIKMCKNCRKCSSPILKGGNGSNKDCTEMSKEHIKWVNTTFDSEWLANTGKKFK